MSGKLATGFEVRRSAAQRLQLVLGGAPFVPFGQKDLDDARDRALANRLVTLTLKRHGQINYVLDQVLDKGLPKRSGLFEASMRLAITQLLFLPETGDHAAIHLAVEVIKKDRRAGRFAKLANAILRKVQRDISPEQLAAEQLAPQWMYQKWLEQYGDERTARMLDAILEEAPLDLSFKPETTDGVAAVSGITTHGQSARVVVRDAAVDQLSGYDSGEWWVQDLAASLPVQLAGPQKGQSALDICAAPGGKTAQLAAAGMDVVAVDNDGARMERVKENLERLQLDARLIVADATELSAEQQFDLVVLDAPCSATGTFRRHPEVIWHRKEKDIRSRAELQKQMLAQAAHLVKPGGTLIYCTCSLEQEEGEEQAQQFLADHAKFELNEITSSEFSTLPDVICANGFLRTLPGMAVSGVSGSLDGFFAARFVRSV